MFAFRKLEVWNLGKEVLLDINKATKEFPIEEKYCLVSQMNRAALSIVSNIAEGSGRWSFKDKAHFTEIAFSSLMELVCQLDIAIELGYLNTADCEALYEKIEVLARKLSSLRNSQLRNV